MFLYERTGKADAAIRDLRELLAERPGDAAVQNALGYTLADHGKQLEEAQSLLAAALAAVTRQCGDPRQHGLAAAPAGQARGGAHCTCSVAGELGNDPEIDLHVGEVQWAMGDQAAARKTWQAALERYPDNTQLQERLKRAGP